MVLAYPDIACMRENPTKTGLKFVITFDKTIDHVPAAASFLSLLLGLHERCSPIT